ncbi:3-hydroxyacyl-CoA dehydrogenase NAD-binding domain-containing protein [Sulfitobacter pacificus]|uniref:3-hydroxyacyl-CoA dehydrogenase n=2 Tax=Sulfitobacter pacificus TaxID=1499314 RepID=A0ABQ5VPU1_9RHOB|nr:3-hydroxyacyl-CoA dehydrogenase NAD-binding domain-containing protein [Sulfitobacter pacificus]GLQ29059.1 3-hydroxyacyl-CoA dehydrogenase [Sulfitobacter pacificus]
MHLVTTHVEAGIAWLKINNPPVNALSRDLRVALIEDISAASANADVRAVVLSGTNGTFIAGADLKEFGHPITAPTLPEVIASIEACPKPVIAAIEGPALGGGYEIALACDGRVALSTASVGLPEGTFGIIPGAGGTVRLPRLTDAAKALEIITSCRLVKAPEALQLGMIDQIVPDLREGAATFALEHPAKRLVRDLPPLGHDAAAFETAASIALKRGKNRPFVSAQVQALRDAVALPFDTALDNARAAFVALRDTDESAALCHLFFAERQAAQVAGLERVSPRSIQSVGIVGAGTMGSGIAAAFLAAGIPVRLTDLQPEALDAARERIAGFLAKARDPASLTIVGAVEDLADCDLLLEAVFEDMAVKSELMARLDRIAKPGTILASNTSYLNLDKLATATSRPEAVVGLHFFAPAHVMKLLEIVRGAETSPVVLKTALALGRRLRKVSVVAGVCEGFIGNRIYNAYRAECEAMLMDGALPQEVDRALETFGFAMGPFAVSDMSGLDIAWANRKRRHAAGEYKGQDVPVLEWLVEAGRLGQKTGAGWYDYVEGNRRPGAIVQTLIERAREGKAPNTLSEENIQRRALSAIINEALLVLEDGIAQRASDIDLVLVNGYGFPRHLGGPLFWASRQPLEQIRSTLAEIMPVRPGNLSHLSNGSIVP